MGLRRRIRAAKARAVLAREARIEAAWGRLPELADLQKRPDQKPEEARASTTDAEATVMKRRRADSSRRTTSNLTVTRPVRGWSASRSSPRAVTWGRGHRWGSRGDRCGRAPDDWRVDGGFPAHDQMDSVATQTRVIAPVLQPKARKTKIDEVAGDPAADEVSVSPEGTVDPHPRKPADRTAVGDLSEFVADDLSGLSWSEGGRR